MAVKRKSDAIVSVGFDPPVAKPAPDTLSPEQKQALNLLSPLPPATSTNEIKTAPPNVPRLPNGDINPDYVPGSNIPDRGLRKIDQSLAEKMRIEQQTAQSNRNIGIKQAFNVASNTPLPSLFDPTQTRVNWGGVGFAAFNEAAGAGIIGATGSLVSRGAGVLGAASAGAQVGSVGGPVGAVIGAVAGIALLGAIKGSISEVRNQKKDTIRAATAMYDRAENLRTELITSARQGADPYELIAAYQEVEQLKITAREALEFAARKDPSGFSDEARAKLYEMKQSETSSMRFVRDQRFVAALLNPSRDLAPEVPEQEALLS